MEDDIVCILFLTNITFEVLSLAFRFCLLYATYITNRSLILLPLLLLLVSILLFSVLFSTDYRLADCFHEAVHCCFDDKESEASRLERKRLLRSGEGALTTQIIDKRARRQLEGRSSARVGCVGKLFNYSHLDEFTRTRSMNCTLPHRYQFSKFYLV